MKIVALILAFLLSYSNLLLAGDQALDAVALDSPIQSTSPYFITSYNGAVASSKVETFFVPTNQEEVKAIVKKAIKNNKKVRAVGALHSTNSIICSDDYSISTEKLNRILGIEIDAKTGDETVVVESGVHLGDLADWLHLHDRSIGYAHVGFRAATIGGLIATGAHGSSVKHTASMSGIVEGITLVDSQGELREFTSESTRDNPNLMKALRTHLGVFGIVVQVKLKIQPQFNIHMKTKFSSDAKIFAKNGLYTELAPCDFGEILWFPYVGKFVELCGVETETKADPGADNYFLSPETSSSVVQTYQKVLEFGSKHRRLNQAMESFRLFSYRLNPNFRKLSSSGKLKKTHEVIGPSHRVVSSQLLSDSIGFPQANWEFAIPYQYTQQALEFTRDQFKSKRLSAPTMGVLLRFIPTEPSVLLAHNAVSEEFHAGEPVALFEFIIYAPQGLSPQKAASYWERHENFANALIQKFHGRPHWGKNKDHFFDLDKANQNHGKNWGDFERVLSELDPQGIFSNSMTQRLFSSKEQN